MSKRKRKNEVLSADEIERRQLQSERDKLEYKLKHQNVKKKPTAPVAYKRRPYQMNLEVGMGKDEPIRRELFLTLYDIGYYDINTEGAITRRGIIVGREVGNSLFITKAGYLRFYFNVRAFEHYEKLRPFEDYVEYRVDYSIGRLMWLIFVDENLDPRIKVRRKDVNKGYALINLTI